MNRPELDTDALRLLAISDTGFVFDPRTGHSYNVNPTGLAILRALKEGATLETVARRLRDEFDIGPAPLDDHLREFLAQVRSYAIGVRANGQGV